MQNEINRMNTIVHVNISCLKNLFQTYKNMVGGGEMKLGSVQDAKGVYNK